MRVHHIEILCRDIKLQVYNLCTYYGFALHGRWQDGLYGDKEKLILKRDSVYFVLYEDKEADCDYVHNIALEVENLGGVCENIPRKFITVGVRTLSEEGCKNSIMKKVKAALVKSPVKNLYHTLLNKSGYNGIFLPNFSAIKDISEWRGRVSYENKVVVNENGFCRNTNNSLSLDHIAYAVNTGTSFDLMEWYSQYLLMERCKINAKEESDGFKVQTLSSSGERLGLKLTAMQYHLCSEESLEMTPHNNIGNGNVKIVFGESLFGQGPNQIDTFLKENGGPGVQHIGLLSNNIFTSIEEWSANNISFIKPPQHYYREIEEKLQQINENGLQQLLEHYGVLFDTEETDKETGKLKYLLQVFTKPIFSKDTFFFELIQRCGATGFGAGNISALWRALDAYVREQNHCT